MSAGNDTAFRAEVLTEARPISASFAEPWS